MFFLDEFEKQVITKKDFKALTDDYGKRSVTYKQLDNLSNKVANKLVSMGVKKGSSVIIILPRIAEYVACEIAIFKIGAVVVPLIPEYPKDRVEFIEKDSDAVIVIRESFFDGIELFSDEEVVCADASDSDRGMILYTSGSTGKPKGVVYTRCNIDAQVIRKLENVRDISPLVFAASATMSFCVTVTEYFRTLAIGGHVHIISDEVRSDSSKLSDYYKENNITAGFISPRILKNFICKSECLKRVFTASEKVVNIYSPDFEIVNAYGQSETVGTITEFLIDKTYDNTPIGKPLKGIEAIVVNQEEEEVLDGEEGEICIIGNLPCEYNNLPDQTNQVFKKLPDGRVLIRSGDIGKKLPDGNLLYLNRNDWMIKIHGQRVEPGEIETVMNTVEGITGSIVKAFENEDGTMLLCGFFTEAKAVSHENIKEKLKSALPDYMIPGVFVKMDGFPVNANGKIARKEIQKPDLSTLTVDYEKPVGEIEEALCNAMEQLLNIKRLGRNDNFLELGGNSLNAVALCSLCKIESLAPQIVMLGQTPKKIAELLAENSFYPKPKLTVSKELKKEYPLSHSQKYQYELCKKNGKSIDCIDTVYFFKLDEDVDIKKLKASVEATVDAHTIYKSHIDIDNNKLIVDEAVFKVEDVAIKGQDFEEYRKNIYKRKRNLKTDPLLEAKLLHIDDGRIYLYMNLCHLVYDGKTVNNLLKEISKRYNNEPYETERATIFDLIDNECSISEDKKLIEEAKKVFASYYEGVKPASVFEDGKKYETAFTVKILEKESQSEIDDFLKKNSISILTLFQAAAEITIRKMFNLEDFCYMNVHDGRGNQILDNSHGVFAKSVFIHSGQVEYDKLSRYFKEIEKQYQKLVYYDIVDTFELASEYPQVMSGITLNLRDIGGLFITLDGKRFFSEFLEEISEAYKPFTDFDFIINRFPKGYGFLVIIASTKVSKSFAEEFVKCFEETVLHILFK